MNSIKEVEKSVILDESEDDFYKYFKIKSSLVNQILTIILDKETGEYFLKADDELAECLGYENMEESMLNNRILDFYSEYKKSYNNNKWPLKVVRKEREINNGRNKSTDSR